MEQQEILSALKAERKSSLDDLSMLYSGHQFKGGILTIILQIDVALDDVARKHLEVRAKAALSKLPEIAEGASIRVVFTSAQAMQKSVNTPKQGKIRMKPEGVRKIILVTSGKGGVGKSTVAANLAIALMDLGHKVGLLDADIYGPSTPKLFGVQKQPNLENDYMLPITSCGISLMSMGFLVAPETAAVWRGPMVSKALQHMLMQTKWGNLDYLIIDTPPGTGDVHLSLAENYQVDAAIVVTTPQDLAVIDAQKTVDMFAKVGIPVLGVVENMSYLIDTASGNHIYIFGKDGGVNLAKKHDIPILAQIPLIPEVASSSDAGKPLTYYKHNSGITHIFTALAQSVAR
ncbi:MAG: P-loop NTPase [Proteobacteria bacterium]|nr:P-loop NTPase [Pseudomonadota bacterium]